MFRRFFSIFVLYGIALCSLDCGGAGRKNANRTVLPVSTLKVRSRGEQDMVIINYGMPRKAYSLSIGIERWFYCDNPVAPVVYDFDVDGMIIHQWIGDSYECQSKENDFNE